MNYSKFLEENNKEVHVFCDMDGVLTEWDQHFFNEVGRHIKDIPKPESYDVIADLPIDWWASLPWRDDGKALWCALGAYMPNLHILSSPSNDKQDKSRKGKRLWLKREGIEKLIGEDHIIIHSAKHKYVKEVGISILIDDTERKINNWVKAGGIGILHTSTKNTLKELDALNL